MSYPPPPWGGYPPTWPPSSPPPAPVINGHDSLALGTTLGQLMAGQERTIYVLELIHARLVTNSEILADRLPERSERQPETAPSPSAPPAPPPGEPMTARDWAQICIAVVVVSAAIADKLPLEQVLPLVLKLLGL